METEPVFIATNKLKEQGLFAARDFKNGEMIFKLDGPIVKEPTKYTIELGHDEHITNRFGVYLNHSCEPNTGIDKIKKVVYAKQDISKGEELSFDYNLNESKMATPFDCACGSKKCQGRITGRA